MSVLITTDEDRQRQVLALIRKHKGEENAINGTDVAEMVGLTGAREVRQVVEALRDRGEPVCGIPPAGYFWPRNWDDALHTLHYLADMTSKFSRTKRNIENGLDRLYGDQESLWGD
jgi:hypothetical protein